MICSLKCVMRYFHEVKFTYCKIHSFDQMGCSGQNSWMWPPGLPVPGSETQKSFTIIGPQCSLLKNAYIIYLLELNETGRGFLYTAIC